MTIYKQIRTAAVEDTELVGKEMAKLLLEDRKLPRFVAIEGDLGVGKTAFVRGFASLASPNSAVRSPTFTLVNEYSSRDSKAKVYHFDMYRITDEDDLYSTGFYDYLDTGAVCLVEWSENIRYAFPKDYWTVRIEKDDLSCPDSRLITIELETKG